MNEDCLKLTVYFGERDRARGGFLADALSEVYARHALQTSLLVRGVEGFGRAQHLRTDRLLTLSEDLPLVSIAVDTRRRIEPVLAEVEELHFDGLVTLERARMLTAGSGGDLPRPREAADETKLTVYVGRQERIAGRPAYEAVVAVLHRRELAGASVLLGVDGTSHGVRARARFFARNANVPLMVIAVGSSERIEAVLPELMEMLPQPLMTLERVRVCKRDGHRVADPAPLPASDPSGLGLWQKLMVYTRETAQHDGEPVHARLVRELRREKAAGATSLRGIWGFHGRHAPHGDSFWQLRRRVPILTVIVDTPERIRRWLEIADGVTTRAGLITCENVPAYRATVAGESHGGLRLADPSH